MALDGLVVPRIESVTNHKNGSSMQIAKTQTPTSPAGSVDWAPGSRPSRQRANKQPSHHRLSQQAALTDRRVNRLYHSSGVSEDVFTDAYNEARRRYPSPVENDMDSHIRAGRIDCVVAMLEQGYPLNPDDDVIDPLVTAISYGSVDTVLTLLRYGADPDSCTCRPMPTGLMCVDHVLRLTDDIDKLVLLLSYGAKVKPMELNYAFAQERLLHLLVYFHWQKLCQQSGYRISRPETVGQLSELVSRLPTAQIHATVDLFEQNQWRVNHLPETTPKGLEEFWSFLLA